MSDEDGMRCTSCGEKHTDWEKRGEPYAPAPDAGGRLQVVRCGRCGEDSEVAVP